MRFRDIARRLTGLSTPVFGVSWNPPKPEIEIARRVISHLEDRRVLFNPTEMEVPQHCVESIIGIRATLSEALSELDAQSQLAQSLRAMRAACRKFLDTVGADPRVIEFGASPGHFASWQFTGAVGELRGVFGLHLAQVAASHGLDIEDDLASILPAEEVTDET